MHGLGWHAYCIKQRADGKPTLVGVPHQLKEKESQGHASVVLPSCYDVVFKRSKE